MKSNEIVLKNRWLVARFDRGDGKLTHLSAAGRGAGLATGASLRYFDQDAKRWWSDDAGVEGGHFGTVLVEETGAAVISVRRSAHLEVTQRYELPPGSPLLRVSVRVRGLGGAAKLGHFAMPRIAFTAGFNDAFEDEEDLYFDGAEAGGGRELRVFRQSPRLLRSMRLQVP